MSFLRLRHTALLAAAVAMMTATVAQAAVETYIPGSQNDPRIRAARYLGADKRHFSALTELLKVQAEVPAPTAQQFPWLLGENYLSFGLRDRADAVYAPLANSSDPLQYARAQLKLAEFEYTRNYLPEARALLLRMREKLPEPLLVDWQDLLSRVLMDQGRYAEAIEVLTAPRNGGDQSQYTRYNLAIALLKDGRVEQGRKELQKVGGSKPDDRDSIALIDRANMVLGWNYLQAKQSTQARPALRQVRVEGPYSNRALLGLGWIELLPDAKAKRSADRLDMVKNPEGDPFPTFNTLGVLLRQSLVDDFMAKGTYKAAPGNSEDIQALNNALPAWLILMDRDPQDPAVQEAWLAIPYALEQAGAHEQARTFYEQAVERLEGARKRTGLAIDALKGDRMVETIVKRDLDAESGWNWELKDLPDAPETYYLQTMLAEHRFAEGLKNYRDTRLIARQLDAWDKRLENMGKAYGSAERASIDPRTLIARAREGHEAPESPVLKINLTLDPSITPPGSYTQSVDFPKLPTPELTLAKVPPAGFVGTFERIGDLRKRLATLRPALAKAGDAQGKYLQRMASKELQAQKQTIEKYLVEARFALARIYDRQSPNVGDPDEYEIKK